MTLITLQGNEVLLVGSDVATGQDCCCGENCDASALDEDAQPDVVVSGSTCLCESGTHNGSYEFTSSDGTIWSWIGTSTCDYLEGASEILAVVTVTVACDAETGNWLVVVSTYQVDARFATGTIATKQLTVENGVLTGTVTVPMESPGTDCELTVTFG